MKRAFVLFVIVFTSSVFAAESTPAQQLKKHFVNDCVARGIERQGDASEAVMFCTCAFDVMAKELSVQEYIEIDRAGQEKRPLDSMPAAMRVKAKLATCKK